MNLHWTFDTVTGIRTGWLHADGPQHIHQDSLGDRYCIEIGRRGDGTNSYTGRLVRYRAAGARVGQFDNLAAAHAACEAHAGTLVPA